MAGPRLDEHPHAVRVSASARGVASCSATSRSGWPASGPCPFCPLWPFGAACPLVWRPRSADRRGTSPGSPGLESPLAARPPDSAAASPSSCGHGHPPPTTRSGATPTRPRAPAHERQATATAGPPPRPGSTPGARRPDEGLGGNTLGGADRHRERCAGRGRRHARRPARRAARYGKQERHRGPGSASAARRRAVGGAVVPLGRWTRTTAGVPRRSPWWRGSRGGATWRADGHRSAGTWRAYSRRSGRKRCAARGGGEEVRRLGDRRSSACVGRTQGEQLGGPVVASDGRSGAWCFPMKAWSCAAKPSPPGGTRRFVEPGRAGSRNTRAGCGRPSRAAREVQRRRDAVVAARAELITRRCRRRNCVPMFDFTDREPPPGDTTARRTLAGASRCGSGGGPGAGPRPVHLGGRQA